MSDKYFYKRLQGRDIFIDDRFDIVKILEIIEIFFYDNCDSRGYLPFGMTELAEELDAQIYHLFPVVNVSVESGHERFTIYVNWDEEMVWRDVDSVTQKVHDVLRGIL